MRQRAAEIALVELEQDHIPLAAFVDNQLERGVERVHPPLGRDLRDSLPLGVLAPGRGGDHDVLPPDAVEQALAARRRLDVAPDPRAILWIGQAFEHGVDPTLERPVRQERPDRRARGGVRVDVGHHVESLGPRRVDQGEDIRHLSPVGTSRRFHVANLDRQVALASDVDRLSDGVQERGLECGLRKNPGGVRRSPQA